MTSSQKVIKGLAIALAVFIIIGIINLIFFIIGGFNYIFINNDDVTYSTHNIYDVSNLNINVSYSKINIIDSDEFKIELNSLCEYSISNNTLIIKDIKKFRVNPGADIYLNLYIPKGKVFNDVYIDAGAGNVKIDTIKANTLDFDMGAGKVSINNIEVYSHAKLDGGAGNFNIENGILSNVDFDMGLGNVDIKASLTGNNKIDMGMGNLSIDLIDSVNNYRFDIEKGIGSVSIDGEGKSNGVYGNGATFIEIDGGIGSINIH